MQHFAYSLKILSIPLKTRLRCVAKEITEAAVGSTTEVLIESGAAYATDEGTVSESSSDEGADETASEIAAEGSSVEAATQADTAPAPEASSEAERACWISDRELRTGFSHLPALPPTAPS